MTPGFKKGRSRMVFSDRDSSILQQGSSAHEYIGSPLVTEALSIMEVVRYAHQMRWKCIQVKSDSQLLVNLINLGGERKELYSILNDIKNSFSFSTQFLLFLIPRKANLLANNLAKSALRACLSPSYNGWNHLSSPVFYISFNCW